MEDQDYILFENYLLGNLSEAEVKTFETRLKSDLKLQADFNTYKELSSFLEHKFENEEVSNAFKNNLETISNSHFNKEKSASKKKQSVKTFNFYKYAVAACILVLFGVFTFNQFSNPMYDDYANYDRISFTVRGDNDELLKTAETAFNDKDFVKAKEAFEELLEKGNTSIEIKLYAGIANIELGDFEVADDILQDINNGESAYKYKATWYLALSKLKQKNFKACLEILKRIPEDADDYKQAQKLIKKLD